MENLSQNQNFLKDEKVESVRASKKFGFRLFLGGVFVLLIFSFLFYFWWQNQTRDELINLVPLDSVFYVSLRETVWPKQKMKIDDLPFGGFYQQLQKKDTFSQINFSDLLNNSQRVSMALVLNEEGNLDFVYIFKLKNSEVIRSFNLPYQFTVGKNILVVAENQKAIDKIQKVKQKSLFSLASQIELKKIQLGLVNFYLSSANLKFYLNHHQDLLNNIFSQLIKDDIYLVLNYKNNQWRVELSNDSFGQPAITDRKELIEYLPADFDLFVSNINLFNFFSSWLSSDLFLDQSFAQTAEILKTVYSFDFNEKLNSLFNQSADLIVFKKPKGNNFLDFNFILVLPDFSSEQISNFEKLIKMVLAQKLPQQVNYLLPDGSKVTELLAKIDKWQWQKEIFNDLEINYLEEPALDFEINYLEDNNLFISNSSDLLKNFIVSRDINLKDLINQCQLKNNYQKSLVINTQDNFLGLKDYLSVGQLIFIEDKDGAKGCFFGLK